MGMGVLGWVHLGKNLAGLFLSPAAISLLSVSVSFQSYPIPFFD